MLWSSGLISALDLDFHQMAQLSEQFLSTDKVLNAEKSISPFVKGGHLRGNKWLEMLSIYSLQHSMQVRFFVFFITSKWDQGNKPSTPKDMSDDQDTIKCIAF